MSVELVENRSADPMLLAYLQNRDVECPNCQYNLRDLLSNRCPECGQEMQLQLSLTEPRLAAYLCGVIALSVSAGFSWLMATYFVITFFIRKFPLPNDMAKVIFLSILVPAVISSILLIFWIYKKRWLRELTSSRRMIVCAISWAVPVINIIVFSLRVR